MKTGAILQSSDLTGITFWLISMALLAATTFFFLERNSVKASWRISMTLSGLVTGIAFVHNIYVRDIWVTTGTAPTVLRYIDWFLTAPLLMIQFYFILSAVKRVSGGIFWRLFVGILIMLIGGYLGEAGYININAGFIIYMAGWIFVLYEIFAGEAGKEANRLSGVTKSCFETCKWIVTIGWAVYPLGYLFGYMSGTADEGTLNLFYNLADFVNKIIFGVVIYTTAISLTPTNR